MLSKKLVALALIIPTFAAAPAVAREGADPRKCLIDDAPQTERDTFLRLVGQWVSTSDLTISQQGYAWLTQRRVVCQRRENWQPALDPILKSITSSTFYIEEASAKLAPSRLDITSIQPYLAGKTPDQLTTIHWSKAVDPTLKRQIETQNRRQLTPTEAKALHDLITWSADIETKVLDFAWARQATNTATLTQRWQLLPVIEANRPQIIRRTLTRAEQNQAKSLSATYLRDNQQRTTANLKVLTELAQSGDREAMIAVRDALASRFGPSDLYAFYSRLNMTSDVLQVYLSVLAAQWTAHIWDMYGYEDAGRNAMSACIEGLYGKIREDVNNGASARLSGNEIIGVNQSGESFGSSANVCGFKVLGAPAYDTRVSNGRERFESRLPAGAVAIRYYDVTGSGSRRQRGDYFVTGIQFNPIIGDQKAIDQRYTEHLGERRAGSFGDASRNQFKILTKAALINYNWLQQYALDTGRLQELELADTAFKTDRDRRVLEYQAVALRQWNEALAKYNSEAPYPSATTVDELQSAASKAGPQYWQQFRRLVPERVPTQIATASTANYGTAGSANNQRVEVRNYNSSGTYVGSTTTSAVWADIMKMGSGPPR
jgi:hypothetical protein